MSEIVSFDLASGEKVYVRASDRGGRAGRVGASDRAAKAAAVGFEAALDKVKPAAAAVVEAFRELSHPEEVSLEFGLELDGKLDAFVFSGEATASFKLTLTWKNEKKG